MILTLPLIRKNFEREIKICYVFTSVFPRNYCPCVLSADVGLQYKETQQFLWGCPVSLWENLELNNSNNSQLIMSPHFQSLDNRQQDQHGNGKCNGSLDPEDLGGPQIWLLLSPLFSGCVSLCCVVCHYAVEG